MCAIYIAFSYKLYLSETILKLNFTLFFFFNNLWITMDVPSLAHVDPTHVITSASENKTLFGGMCYIPREMIINTCILQI